MPSKPCFSLGDRIAGVFAEICEKNGITNFWLQWKFELAVLNDEYSPFTIEANNDSQCGHLRDGVKKVAFTVDFDRDQPSVINYIRFTEFHDGAENKHYIVTQTSIDHLHEDTDCMLWLELPSGTRKDDIGSVINLWRVKICCDRWQDFLPTDPVTQLEKAHRVLAGENLEWLKMQLLKRDSVVARMEEELEQKSREIDKLTGEVSELHMQLADMENELKEARSREVASATKRKTRTPKSRVRQTPKTPASAKASPQHATPDVPTTPSKRARLSIDKNDGDDPFVAHAFEVVD
ncbi:hypothetical protein VPNG_06060 [Cytospora leucostoma]|uniref:Uncharacterized protein n=1 Tax=Cytospora leucostoma TaxID=1230097 RepID=A0A423WX33_9PEZI|nr:hypothetical protein VPNG_06060 [Cytospora leucostoma]